MTTRVDRIKGVLAGQAAGDALGAPYEFQRPPKVGEAVFGGKGTFGHEPGAWTDDTEQASIVVQNYSDPLQVGAGLLAWYAHGPVDVGGTTAAALHGAHGNPEKLAPAARRAAQGRNPHHVSNGSLMRTGPVCLPFLGDRAKIAMYARAVSRLTHGSDYAGDACVIWSLLIDAAIAQGEEFRVESQVEQALFHIPGERQAYWGQIVSTALSWEPVEFRDNGKAVVAFQAALSAVYHAESLTDGLQRVIAIGGDADTTAAIAGALLGAIYGASAVPETWRKVIHGWPGLELADLEELAVEAASLAGGEKS